MSDADNLDRRTFARHCLGGIGAASFIGAGGAISDDQPSPPALPEDATAESDERTPPAELLILSALIQYYPSGNYTDEIYRNIYREIVGDAARGKQLRVFPLKNSDEPACVFRVLRTEGRS